MRKKKSEEVVETSSVGFIKIFLGSMKSSKTSKLYEIIDQAKYRKKRVCLVRSSIDTREFVARFKDEDVDTIICKTMIEDGLLTKLRFYDIICIDEGQFIKGMEPICHLLALEGKEVYIAALSADCDMKPWDNMTVIIGMADYIEKLHGACEICGSNVSTFTWFTGDKTEQIHIGDGEYQALCRKCWDAAWKKKNTISRCQD